MHHSSCFCALFYDVFVVLGSASERVNITCSNGRVNVWRRKRMPGLWAGNSLLKRQRGLSLLQSLVLLN